MRRKSKNLLASLTMFALLFSLFQPTFAVGAEGTLATPLVEKENVEITSGTFYDLSGSNAGHNICGISVDQYRAISITVQRVERNKRQPGPAFPCVHDSAGDIGHGTEKHG